MALPWYVDRCPVRSGGEFFRTFIIKHNIQRFAGEVAAGGQHVEPFYYYIPVVLLGVLPWTFFLPSRRCMAPVKDSWSAQAIKTKGCQRTPDPRLFPLLWAAGGDRLFQYLPGPSCRHT